jgi:predicted RNA-binding protein YlqC (UPF0109 family)
MLKHIIEYTVKSLVEFPDQVSIASSIQDSKEIFEIRVNNQDIGKVIGKDGQTIRAIRMLLYSMIPQGQEIEVTVAK